MAGVQARVITAQADGKTSLKCTGASSQSDQSSNSSRCSQGGSFQYLTSGSELISVSAGANPLPGANDINLLLVGSANSSAGGSSLISGGNSVISGNSNVQHSVNMNGDSIASSGGASLGLPTSPLSFSSSNVNFVGSSGLPLSRSVEAPINGIDTEQDPSFHPPKLWKVESSQQVTDKLLKQGLQTGVVGNCQPLGCGLCNGSTGQSMPRFGGQGLQCAEYLRHSNQHGSQVLPYTVGRDDLLQQHQVRQNMFQRPCTMLTQHQETPQQQSQLMQAQILQQQCLLQQEQMLRTLPPQIQRSRVLQQQQQQHAHQLQQQIASMTRQMPNVVSGAFTRRLMQCLQHQRTRPADNNIGFWREFISEYFTPRSRKRFCLSQCTTNGGRQPTGVFPQDLWRCEICGSSPGRGFEVGVDVLPRLCKTKFDNGELEDLLFVDLAQEYKLSSGLTVLEYRKAVQESVFENLRVTWDGQLRLIFTQDLKILSWDFCAKKHEELLPRRAIFPQVNQLVMLASKCQAAMAENMGNGICMQDLQAACNMFVSCTRQLGKSLEPSYVNELGFTKRFVRCIQIAEVVNSMKDLMDFSWEKGIGPNESLQKFPCRKASTDMPNIPMQLPTMTMPHVPMQLQSTAMAQCLAESNGVLLNGMPKQASPLNRTVSGQINALPPLQKYLHRNSNSFTHSDPLIMRSTSGHSALSRQLQASPTGSLTSLQSSLTSLNPNQPLGHSGNGYELPQLAQQVVHGSSAQQHLQGVRNAQLMAGTALFSPSNQGNVTDNGTESGAVTHGAGGVCSGSMGGIGGLPNNSAANIAARNGINMGLQHLDCHCHVPQVGKTGVLMQGGLGSSVSQLSNARTLMQSGLLNLDSLEAQLELDHTQGLGGNDLAHHSYD